MRINNLQNSDSVSYDIMDANGRSVTGSLKELEYQDQDMSQYLAPFAVTPTSSNGRSESVSNPSDEDEVACYNANSELDVKSTSPA